MTKSLDKEYGHPVAMNADAGAPLHLRSAPAILAHVDGYLDHDLT